MFHFCSEGVCLTQVLISETQPSVVLKRDLTSFPAQELNLGSLDEKQES